MRIIALIIFILFALTANAHEAPVGWEYDASCCSNEDCRQLPQGAIRLNGKGYYIKELRRTIPYGSIVIESSKDRFYHICQVGSYVACLYVPKGVS